MIARLCRLAAGGLMAGTGASASNHGPLSARIFMHQQQADIFPNGRRNDDFLCVALRSLGMRPLAEFFPHGQTRRR